MKRIVKAVVNKTKALRERLNGSLFYAQKPIVIPDAQYVIPEAQWYVNGEPTKGVLETQRKEVFSNKPLITMILPIKEILHESLIELFNSLKAQTYSNWEAHVIDNSGEKSLELKKLYRLDKRIKYHYKNRPKLNNNYIGFLKQNYTLSPFALYEIVCHINNHADTDVIYCDEDKINEEFRYELQLKPEFAPDTLLSNNYIKSFFFIKKDILAGFNMDEIFNEDNYFKLILHASEHAKRITHIIQILTHKRYNRNYSTQEISRISTQTIKYIQEHVKRLHALECSVIYNEKNNTYSVIYDVAGTPKVSILIPNKDNIKLLKGCIESLVKLTTYANYEIVVIENNSQSKDTFTFYDEIKAQPYIRVLHYPHSEFNYQKIINFGVKNSDADFIVQLNNDIELLTPNWLELMIGYAQRSDVGAVGVKLLLPDMSNQFAGGAFVNGVECCFHLFREMPRDADGYMKRANIIQNLSWVTGACMMSRREIYKQVDFMDESFIIEYGDIGFCMKIKKLGKLIIYNPLVELIHFECQTRGSPETNDMTENSDKEKKQFQQKWNEVLIKNDPYYNPQIGTVCER